MPHLSEPLAEAPANTTLIIGGAPKSGTSAVFRYLSAHPDIAPSVIKETAFFIDQWIDNPADCQKAYDRLFPADMPSALRLEASTGYLGYSAIVAPRARQLLGEHAKFIFILRDPVDRLFSYYRYRKGNQAFPDTLSFADYLEACEAYEKSAIKHPDLDEYDLQIMMHGKYATHIHDFIECFGRDAVLLLAYETLSSDPVAFMQNVCQFAGIDPAIYADFEFKKVNVSVSARIGFLHRIALFINHRLERFLRRNPHIKDALKTVYMRLNTTQSNDQNMPDDLHRKLNHYYSASTDALLALVNRNEFPWVSRQ